MISLNLMFGIRTRLTLLTWELSVCQAESNESFIIPCSPVLRMRNSSACWAKYSRLQLTLDKSIRSAFTMRLLAIFRHSIMILIAQYFEFCSTRTKAAGYCLRRWCMILDKLLWGMTLKRSTKRFFHTKPLQD